MTTREIIKNRLSEKKMSLKELALQTNYQYQNLSSALQGKRMIPISNSLAIDEILELQPGTIAHAQTEEQIRKTQNSSMDIQKKKAEILNSVKKNGGLWSYQEVPKLKDDDIIEEALLHLDFEEMPKIFDIWGRAHVKRIWKERLVSQGKRLNILNTLLGVIFFNIYNIEKYLLSHANHHTT